MELIPLRCTKCGADIHDYNPDSRVAKCTALGCEATFLVEQGRQFADRDAEDAAKIGVLRENLAFFIGHGNDSKVADKANEILALVPGDFLAQFYTVLAQKKLNDPRGYRRFLDAPPAATEEEYTEAFGVILRSLEVAEQEDAEKYVRATAGTVPEDVRYAWIDQLRGAIDRLKKEAELFDLYPRDVFISYSHVDAALAREVVKCLEQDGVTCWVAYRNLDNTTNANYWEKIRYSVEHCKVFLCIATDASMHSADVTKELDFALLAPQRPKLLEYKADAAPHTTKFKKAFDGLSWIDGMDGDEGSRAKAFEQMRERVYDLMNPAPGRREPQAKRVQESQAVPIQEYHTEPESPAPGTARHKPFSRFASAPQKQPIAPRPSAQAVQPPPKPTSVQPPQPASMLNSVKKNNWIRFFTEPYLWGERALTFASTFLISIAGPWPVFLSLLLMAPPLSISAVALLTAPKRRFWRETLNHFFNIFILAFASAAGVHPLFSSDFFMVCIVVSLICGGLALLVGGLYRWAYTTNERKTASLGKPYRRRPVWVILCAGPVLLMIGVFCAGIGTNFNFYDGFTVLAVASWLALWIPSAVLAKKACGEETAKAASEAVTTPEA